MNNEIIEVFKLFEGFLSFQLNDRKKNSLIVELKTYNDWGFSLIGYTLMKPNKYLSGIFSYGLLH